MEGQFGRRTFPLDPEWHEPAHVWRCGALLVAEHGATLPARCVRCNRPVDGPAIRCRLFESPTKWWLLTILGVIPWYVVRAARGRRSHVHAHFCEIHRGRQRAAIRIAILFWATGVVMIVLALSRHGLNALGGLLALLIGLLVWLLSPGTLSAARIDHDHVWIEGIDRGFLAQLPARAGDYSLN
jgi:hypothetical protein